MSNIYQGISWNRQKKQYDAILWLLICFYLLLFVFLNFKFHPEATLETTLIRATGTLAALMLHVVLSIGPLARIDKRFLMLLYNRRHLGVSMFLIALVHGILNIAQFHALGNVNPLVSLFTSNTHYTSFIHFPFQTLGFFALLILFIMAATSHDFWLKNLSPAVWKYLHMLVYAAYALMVMHVMLGVVQLEHHMNMLLLMLFGMTWLAGLHLYSGYLESKRDAVSMQDAGDGFLRACHIGEIPENRAKIFSLQGERVAVFKYQGKISAVSNVCRHQMGPLGEGRIIDGCITCPWHGYQYRPQDGCAPPPFTEKIATYRVKLKDNIIYIHHQANEAGTYIEPVQIPTIPDADK